jgi:hypothetical protein
MLNSTLNKYPNICKLITEKDIKKWENLSNKYKAFLEEYVYKVNFNILTILVASTLNYEPAMNLLTFLEDSLKIFPELINSKEFKKNIKSLEEFSFLSFLSELSVARRYKSKGYDIKFNFKYKKFLKNEVRDKDVDLEVADNNGNKIYIDVYTPYKRTDINGPGDLSIIEDKFRNQLVNKQYDKFFGLAPNQLNGKKILEVNCAYHDDSLISLALTGGQYDIKGIVGVQLFHHDIASSNESQMIKYIPLENYL